MQMTRTGYVCLVAAVLTMVGCHPPNPRQGFYIGTSEGMQSAQGGKGPQQPMVGVEVSGQYFPQPGDSPDGGNVTSYLGYTSKSKNPDSTQGLYYVSNAMTDVYWDHQVWLPDDCATPVPPVFLVNSGFGTDEEQWGVLGVFMTNTGQMQLPDPDLVWECLSPPGQPLPQLSSQFAFTGEIPTSVTMAGWHPYTAANGMPEMYIFSGAGGNPSFYTEIDASSVDPSGATATFDLPSNMPQNAYAFETVNQNADGTLQHQGFNYFAAASQQTIAGNPFGVSVGAQTDTYQGYQLEFPDDGPPQGVRVPFSGTRYITFPVVSLYSNNQVLINGTAVGVGKNPTVVATYASEAVTTPITGYNLFGTDTYSGNTRAIVANSGENTVSILDIVNDALLDIVTVGSQPVALVVSPDGTTAYVANYTDSTVTEVNLNTDTPVTTVAVGGQPTSVALSAPSTLWVGGVGFLTQINTQNMSVVATQSTAGETIAALGFSGTVNELIATTMNSSGGVNVDEVSPSSVSPGTLYTAVASHPVSTLGTYFSPRTQNQVRGFTATVAQSLVPVSTNQVGAPPLVVQDGWAVVSATPTGFSITDASGHAVLASETTPSPIAAIAVDTNLNVAYLTMPDANTLLTVPLPGTSGTPGTTGASGSFAVTATNNNPAQTALSLGHSMSYTINVSPLNGFTGTVALWIDGLPAGVAASLSADSVTSSGSATLTLTSAYSASTFIGSSTVTVTGTSEGVAQSTLISLTTQPLQYRGYCGVQ